MSGVSRLFVALVTVSALCISLLSLMQLHVNSKASSMANWGEAPLNVAPPDVSTPNATPPNVAPPDATPPNVSTPNATPPNVTPPDAAIGEWEGSTNPNSNSPNSLILNALKQTAATATANGEELGDQTKETNNGPGPGERSSDKQDGAKGLEDPSVTRWSPVEFEPVFQDVFVFAVYLDQRLAGSSCVRIFVLQTSSSSRAVRLTCGFDGVAGRFRAEAYEMCENHDKKYGGWIYSCPVPDEAPPPTDVVVHVVSREGRVLNKVSFPVVAVEARLKNRHSGVEPISPTEKDINGAEPISDAVVNVVTNKRNDSQLAGHKTNFDRINRQGTYPKTHILGDPKEANISIGVCVPPLHDHLFIENLVAFIEFSRILGAEQLFLYTHNMPEDFLAVLSAYMGAATPNILSLTDWPLPPQASTYQDIWNHGQILAIQHCLYTNMAHFDWLLFIDIDEMIIPQQVDTWQDMIKSAVSEQKTKGNSQNVVAISFPSAYFQQSAQTSATSSIRYFSHLDRTVGTDFKRSKLLVDPKKVFELGIHHVSRAMGKDMEVVGASPDLGLLHHYRQCTEDAPLQCGLVEEDLTILRYEPKVTNTSRQIMINGNKKATWEKIR